MLAKMSVCVAWSVCIPFILACLSLPLKGMYCTTTKSLQINYTNFDKHFSLTFDFALYNIARSKIFQSKNSNVFANTNWWPRVKTVSFTVLRWATCLKKRSKSGGRLKNKNKQIRQIQGTYSNISPTVLVLILKHYSFSLPLKGQCHVTGKQPNWFKILS